MSNAHDLLVSGIVGASVCWVVDGIATVRASTPCTGLRSCNWAVPDVCILMYCALGVGAAAAEACRKAAIPLTGVWQAGPWGVVQLCVVGLSGVHAAAAMHHHHTCKSALAHMLAC